MRATWCALAGIGMLAGMGCATITVKHEVPPIFATVDVNIHVQEELEQVFDFEQPRGATATTWPAPAGDQP